MFHIMLRLPRGPQGGGGYRRSPSPWRINPAILAFLQLFSMDGGAFFLRFSSHVGPFSPCAGLFATLFFMWGGGGPFQACPLFTIFLRPAPMNFKIEINKIDYFLANLNKKTSKISFKIITFFAALSRINRL